MRYLVPFGLGIAALVAMGAARLSSRAHRGSRTPKGVLRAPGPTLSISPMKFLSVLCFLGVINAIYWGINNQWMFETPAE
jgi:hypothetical protein